MHEYICYAIAESAVAEHQWSYTKVTKSYYFQHRYIHDGSCEMRDTNIAMFNRQHRRQQIRRRLRSNRYACRFIQNQNTVAYNYIININVTSIITQHLHSSKRSTMIRKFNNATIIDEDSAIQLAGKERHHGQSIFSVLRAYREREENQLLK